MILGKMRTLLKARDAGPAPGPAPPQAKDPGDPIAAQLDELARRGYSLLFAQRAGALVVLLASRAAPQFSRLSGESLDALASRIRDGAFTQLLVRRLRPDGSVGRLNNHSDLLDLVRTAPTVLDQWAVRLGPEKAAALGSGEQFAEAYLGYLRTLRSSPDLIDFLYLGFTSLQPLLELGRAGGAPPFDEPSVLPPSVPAQPRQKSALFLHNSYYHYNHLAEGLRRRGWDTMTVSIESPDSPHQQFYHGEDLNLFHDDPQIMRDRTRAFFATVPERFGALHFYTKGLPTFFPDNGDKLGANLNRIITLPWDMMELRRHRMVIGYMASGSLDGARQSSIRKISGGLCNHCVWEMHPEVCNDVDNAIWAQRLEAMCDWVGLENDWATPERTGRQYVRYPVITALDPEAWRPDLEPMPERRIERAPGELLIYHAVGNYSYRRSGHRDLKGTGAVMDAVSRLQSEGFPVRLIFATDVPSRVVRHIQVQADIVVDQLNYGRMGANAREALMLGKPLIVKMDPRQAPPLADLAYIAEAPVVNADETTVYEALKGLIDAPERRAALGIAARAFALKWHSADACAERFEDIVDRVRAGSPPENPAVAAPSRAAALFEPQLADL